MRAIVIPAILAACLGPLPQSAARTVSTGSDEVVEVRARVRFATTVILPPDESILDWVCGDAEYWSVQGAANLAFIKPTADGIETNLTLVTDKGNVYALRLREVGTGPESPDLRLFIRAEADDADGGRLEPARFEAAGASQACRAEADEAMRSADEARERSVAAARDRAEQFRASYPRSMRFDYRLETGASNVPFRVAAMWRDDRFTYIRADPEEAAALYEARDGKPSMVPYDFAEGLYVTRRPIADGWLQIGKRRLRFWRIAP